ASSVLDAWHREGYVATLLCRGRRGRHPTRKCVSASRTHRTQVLPWEGSGTERGEAIGSNHRFSGISVSRPASRRVDCPRHSGPRVGHSSVCDADLATGEDGEDERLTRLPPRRAHARRLSPPGWRMNCRSRSSQSTSPSAITYI